MNNTRALLMSSLLINALILTACGQFQEPAEEQPDSQATVQMKTDVDAQNTQALSVKESLQEQQDAVASVATPRHDLAIHDTATVPSVQEISPQPMRKAKKMEYYSSAKMAVPAAKMHRSIAHSTVMAPPYNTEKYSAVSHNKTTSVQAQPVSTFSIDVDTASYSNMRRFLRQGQMPPVDAIRVEEMINYFSYDYAKPDKHQAFSVTTEMGPAPWDADKQLLHIGIQGQAIDDEQRPVSNLVFLIDVSGSMQSAHKLGMLKTAMKMLTQQMQPEDLISIVVYAGNSGIKLAATSGREKAKIIQAIDALAAGGSTHGSAGIQAAYALAEQHFIKGGINRIMLATDGDFNVGLSDERSLKQLIEDKRKSGISLSVLGFGAGNYNDSLMQTLAQNGNGNAYYIDNLNEARKVLVEELSATLMTIAKDVKIQIEFNPAVVSEYRLIGYETRHLNREDFNNDAVDAGEIGAGHTVTALYELTLTNSEHKQIDALRYQAQSAENTASVNTAELAYLRLRHKQPNGNKSQLQEVAIPVASLQQKIEYTTDNYRFSAAVAAFAQLLRHEATPSTMSWPQLIALAQSAKGSDDGGYRSEFIQLIKLAETLQPQLAKQ